MNISLPTLFNTYYNLINDKLSNLSSSQKKVAMIAIAYFSLATLGYLIYSCYLASRVSVRKEDEEEILSPVPQAKPCKEGELSADKTNVENHSPRPSFAMQELKKKLEERLTPKKDGKTTSLKVTEVATGVQVSSQAGGAQKKEVLAMVKVTPETKIAEEEKRGVAEKTKIVEFSQKNDETFVDVGSEELESFAKKKQSFPTPPTKLTLDALEALRNLSNSPQNIDSALVQAAAALRLSSSSTPSSSPSSSTTSSSVPSDVEPSPIDERYEDVRNRLEKNRTAARTQQAAEKEKKFAVKMATSSTDLFAKSIFSEQKTIEMRQVGIAASQGPRVTMEDVTEVNSLTFSINGILHQASVFAVFDGHGGAEAAIFAKEKLMGVLKEAMESHNQEGLTDVGIWDALKACFKKLDDDYQGKGGTTASVVLHLKEKIWVATAGDSRTILVKNNETIQTSEDAKPSIPRYENKIEKLGGYVAENRVNGNLATARAIGDKDIKGNKGECCVSPNPKITNYLSQEFLEGYLVIACDGLYDVASTNAVGQAIREMADQELPPEQMAAQLVYNALTHKSKDNVSVIVVKL
jgi:serine/threonine protein phosphatase PrpC